MEKTAVNLAGTTAVDDVTKIRSVDDHLLYASPDGYPSYFLASTNKLGDYHLKGPMFEHILSESFPPVSKSFEFK